ncbi:MAG: T9SS type A sorting domain-containing protein [Bacteroidia bacterium]|nr:T9SS type A sorting domain-containing protein [Bacteroidia bacterium]
MKNLYLILIGILTNFCVQAQTLNGISPNTGFAGQQNLSTTITGTNLFQVTISPNGNIYDLKLRQGTSVISIYDYQSSPWSGGVQVVDPGNATAIFSIPSNAVLGLYDLELTTTDPFQPGTNLQPYSVAGAFTITAPDGYISGKVYNDLNENRIFDTGDLALPNQNMSLQPGSQTVQTDANGNYSFGVVNGSYTVSVNFAASHAYVLTTDSLSYTVVVNSANQTGLDFGAVDGLTSLAPGVGYQGQLINSNVTSRSLFALGANPYGNITSAFIQKTSPTNTYTINVNSFLVIDSVNAQLLYQIPVNAALGVYSIAITAGNKRYYLDSALTIIAPPSYLRGHCYYDANNNGMYDVGELPIQNARLDLIPENSYAFSNSGGNYAFGAALGTHTLSFSPFSVSNFTLTTQSSYTFTNTGDSSGFDFGFRSSLPDYSANFSFNPGFMRCFQTVASTITFTNTSNVVSQGQVYLIHSPNTVYQSAVPPISNQNGDTLFWSFTNLQPMETRTIIVNLTNPANGTVQFNTGIKVTDGSGVQQFQDGRSFNGTVMCSYDPNDKAAFPEGVDDVMHYTLNSETLEYLIRFQNCGNDTAFTVYIRDTIDASLDINTLEVLASSHSVQTTIDANRAVVFMFEDILLADSVVDEPNSHGFVRYRISPLTGLADPTRIENTAYIYFDFNPAVVTNTTWNTMVLTIPVGLNESIEIDSDVRFYPNPMGEKGYFSIVNSEASLLKLDVYDIKGAIVTSVETTGELIEVNRKELSSGLYFFRLVNTESGKIHTGKISLR